MTRKRSRFDARARHLLSVALLCALLAAALFWLSGRGAAPAVAGPQGTVSVTLAPELLLLPPAGSVEVHVDAGATALAFARVELLFDPEVAALETVTVGAPFLPVTTSSPAEANSTGRIVIAARAPQGNPPAGRQTLATLRFAAASPLAEQQTTLALDPGAAQIVGSEGAALSVLATPARLGVNPAPASCLPVLEIPPAECGALRAFYSASGGANWGNWFEDTTPCTTWTGITCREGHVSGLRLPGREVAGSLPATIGDLAHLQVLDLAGNALGGPLPPTLGGLERLEMLDVSGNSFGGAVPAGLAGLPLLHSLDLDDNLLFAPDPQVAALLDVRAPGWADTQTVPPADLAVAATGSDTLALSWQPVAGASADRFYELYWAQAAGGPYRLLASVASADGGFSPAGLAPDSTYFFKVRTVSLAGAGQSRARFSAFSPTVQGTTLLPAPAAISASRGLYADRVHVEWAAVLGATGYEVERRWADGGWYQIATTGDTGYDDRTTADQTLYLYRVAACKAQRCGEKSIVVAGFQGTLPEIFLPALRRAP